MTVSKVELAWKTGGVLKRAIWGFVRDDGAALSGYMAYTALLAIFPFLIFATSLIGQIIGEEGIPPTMNFLFDSMPEHVAKTIEPALREAVAGRGSGIASFSAIAAIYVASNGFEALRVALDRAYDTSSARSFWVSRLVSVTFTLGGVFAFGLLVVSIILGPILMETARQWFDYDLGSLGLWHKARYLIGVSVLIVFLMAIHRHLPGRRPAVPVLPGVLVTTVLWIAMASLFSVYFTYVPSYTITYGTLAGVIASLLFFYMTGAIFIFGAEINAALDPQPRRTDGEPHDVPLL